jgi:hypothetical protein
MFLRMSSQSLERDVPPQKASVMPAVSTFAMTPIATTTWLEPLNDRKKTATGKQPYAIAL